MTELRIGKRHINIKDENNWSVIDSIPKDEVCVVCLGGNKTNTDEIANSFAKYCHSLFSDYDKNISLYSVIYTTDTMNSYVDTQLFFSNYHNKQINKNGEAFIESIKKAATEENFNPPYIKDLYKKVIEPRISSNGGKQRIKTEDALKNIRKVTFFAYCYGGTVALMLEQFMQKEMVKLGYSSSEVKDIQNQMITIAKSPSLPFGKAKSQIISFASNKDKLYQRPKNIFNHFIGNKPFQACYFPKKQGNLFLIHEKFKNIGEELLDIDVNREHALYPKKDTPITKDGITLELFLKNVLINTINNSTRQDKTFTPIEPINELVLSQNESFNTFFKKTINEWLNNGRTLRSNINIFGLQQRKLLKESNSLNSKV